MPRRHDGATNSLEYRQAKTRLVSKGIYDIVPHLPSERNFRLKDVLTKYETPIPTSSISLILKTSGLITLIKHDNSGGNVWKTTELFKKVADKYPQRDDNNETQKATSDSA